MDIREATETDIDEIREVASASLEASYQMLDEELRERAVDAWYGGEGLAEDLTDEDAFVVVALDDGDVVGFAQGYLEERRELVGRIDWIHVHPDHRGERLGEQLLHRVETDLLEAGAARVEGRVLEVNEEGLAFYEEQGYEASSERTIELGDETFTERVFVRAPEAESTPQEPVAPHEGPEGESLYIAYDESDRGSKAPFYVAYSDEEREDKYGWFCGNCESFDVNMDSMGRVECDDCGNRRKPTRWDSSYL